MCRLHSDQAVICRITVNIHEFSDLKLEKLLTPGTELPTVSSWLIVGTFHYKVRALLGSLKILKIILRSSFVVLKDRLICTCSTQGGSLATLI